MLWRDGEHEPNGDPEAWIDRVTDEVEEKRLQKMQVLEKPEGSSKGISNLTTRSVFDWRKKPYRFSQEMEEKIKTSCKRICLRRKKRDDIFSPATSGHVLKHLPTIFLQRISEEDEAREGEGAFSQVLGCLDVKDAFLTGEAIESELEGRKNSW